MSIVEATSRYISGALALKELELGHRDDDRQAVDKAEHSGLGDKADKLAHFENTGKELDQTGHDGGEGDVLQHTECELFTAEPLRAQHGTGLKAQCDKYDGDRAGRTRDHARFAADKRSDEPQDKGGVEPDDRADIGDEGEGDRFGNEGNGDDEPRKDVVFDVSSGVV